MSYRLSYLEDFHFSNLLAASEAGCWKKGVTPQIFAKNGVTVALEGVQPKILINLTPLIDWGWNKSIATGLN